jgi:hypothetical protein
LILLHFSSVSFVVGPLEDLWSRQAGEFVAANTTLVRFNAEKIKTAAELIYEEAKKDSLKKIEFHSHELHPKFEHPEQTARW